MSKYVVFDGMDGSGKGTQIKLLQEKLSGQAVFTREPGGTPFAEEIRKVVRDNPLAGKSTALNNFLLFWAAREELLQNLITPVLQSGRHVFSDRGDSSTYAFQICGEQNMELVDLFISVRNHLFYRPHRRPPDLYIVFDLPAETARKRVMGDVGRDSMNHFDARDLAYYERVRRGFHKFAEHQPVEFIDATRSPEEVHRDVLMMLAGKMIIPELAFVID